MEWLEPSADEQFECAEPNMKKMNFDRYLDKKRDDPAFAQRFLQAGETYVAQQVAAMRVKARQRAKPFPSVVKKEN